MTLSNWLKQGSTAVGIVGALGTGALAIFTPLVANHSPAAIIAAAGSFLLMLWPEGKGYISTTEALLTELEPVVVQAWPYIERALDAYEADQKQFVPTPSGR